MLNILKNTINRVFASGVDSDASAFITATGLSGTTQKSAITTLVKDLKASGLWSKMKAVYPMVTDNYNLLSYTEDFSNALWTKLNSTVSANATTNPFGLNTATKLIENSGSGSKYVALTTTSTTIGQTYTFSVYLKAAERTWAIIGEDLLGTGYFWVNLSNGTFGTGAGTYISRSITSAGNGWYKITVTYSAAATSANGVVFIANADNNINYVGNGTSGIYISSPQLELGSSTTSTYQPILTTPSAFMASQMKYNLKDARDLDAAFRLTWSGGWTYSSTGATPNGTNAYADTKLNLLSNLSGYDSSFSVYYRQDLYGTYKIGAFGTNFDQGISAHLGWTNSSGTLYNDHLGRNTIVNSTYGTFNAYHISSVTSTASQKLYRNGVLKVSGAATSGITMPSLSFYFGAANANGTANYFDPKQIAFGTLSTGLTDSDAMLLNQIVEKYQVALSRGVQAAQSFYYNSAYSNEANTYLYSTQITGTTQVSAINTLINGLKANNLWSKMKAVYPFVTDYTNLLSYTEDFSNAYWVKTNATVTANSITDPNGTLTADTETLGSLGYIATTVSYNGNVQTYSCYVKKKTDSIGYIGIYDTVDKGFWFNFDTGLITQSTSGVSNQLIVNSGNGWYRVSFTFTNSNSNTYIALPTSRIASGSTTRGTDIYLWGAQLENGSIVTPYQPVLGANNYQSNVAAQMKFNLVNPQDSDAAFRLAFSGGWTYSTNGALPNGTNGYADTKLVPSTSLSTSSAHFSKYNRTNDLVGNKVDGSIGTTSTYFMQQNYSAGNAIIGDVSSIMSYTPTDTRGLFTATRTSASLGKIFRNSAQVSSSTSTIVGMSDRSMYLGARNDLTVTFYNAYQIAFSSIGDGLTDAEAALLYQLVQDFQTTLSRQV